MGHCGSGVNDIFFPNRNPSCQLPLRPYTIIIGKGKEEEGRGGTLVN